MAGHPPSILLTRPRADSERIAAQLKSAGVTSDIVVSPIVSIEPTGAEVSFAGVKGAVFSSRNGVACVSGQDLPAWCVGEATAEAARAKGWRAVAADGDADSLYARVLADQPAGPIVHIRGEKARGDLASRLTKAGIETREAAVYRQAPLDMTQAARSLLSQANPVIVPLFSPFAAEAFVDQGPFPAPLVVVAMSEAVRDALGEFPVETVVLAKKKEASAMLNAVVGLLDAP